MTSAASPICLLPPATLVEQYEMLRQAALGEALPVQARGGLALFLRRGMWGWARTLSAASEGMAPIQSPSSAPAMRSESKGVIRVFAAIATNVRSRRAP